MYIHDSVYVIIYVNGNIFEYNSIYVHVNNVSDLQKQQGKNKVQPWQRGCSPLSWLFVLQGQLLPSNLRSTRLCQAPLPSEASTQGGLQIAATLVIATLGQGLSGNGCQVPTGICQVEVFFREGSGRSFFAFGLGVGGSPWGYVCLFFFLRWTRSKALTNYVMMHVGIMRPTSLFRSSASHIYNQKNTMHQLDFGGPSPFLGG